MRLYELKNPPRYGEPIERLVQPNYYNGEVIADKGGFLVVQGTMEDGSKFDYDIPHASDNSLRPGAIISKSPIGSEEKEVVFIRTIGLNTAEIESRGKGRPDRRERVPLNTIRIISRAEAEQ